MIGTTQHSHATALRALQSRPRLSPQLRARLYHA